MKFLFSLILIGVIAYFGWQNFLLDKKMKLYMRNPMSSSMAEIDADGLKNIEKISK
jgi:hypothetical protein